MDLDQIYDAHVESLVRVLAPHDIVTEALTRHVAKMVQELTRIWGIPADEIVRIHQFFDGNFVNLELMFLDKVYGLRL